MAERIVSTIGSPSDERIAAMADAALDAAKLRREFETIRASYGACRLGETRDGDGVTEARVLLECDRGQIELRYRTGANGKLAGASFLRPASVACVP
jgi:hypothetical protein